MSDGGGRGWFIVGAGVMAAMAAAPVALVLLVTSTLAFGVTGDSSGQSDAVPGSGASHGAASGSPTPVTLNDGEIWESPVFGPISSPFGARGSVATGAGMTPTMHTGTDIAPGCGKPIYAAAPGRVTFAGHDQWGANLVMIDDGTLDGQRIVTWYAHMEEGSVPLHKGDNVSAGALVGLVGKTGLATGCHLHFETRVNGIPMDANVFMRAKFSTAVQEGKATSVDDLLGWGS